MRTPVESCLRCCLCLSKFSSRWKPPHPDYAKVSKFRVGSGLTGIRVGQHARYMNAGALSSILAAKKKAAAIPEVSEPGVWGCSYRVECAYWVLECLFCLGLALSTCWFKSLASFAVAACCLFVFAWGRKQKLLTKRRVHG